MLDKENSRSQKGTSAGNPLKKRQSKKKSDCTRSLSDQTKKLSGFVTDTELPQRKNEVVNQEEMFFSAGVFGLNRTYL